MHLKVCVTFLKILCLVRIAKVGMKKHWCLYKSTGPSCAGLHSFVRMNESIWGFDFFGFFSPIFSFYLLSDY